MPREIYLIKVGMTMTEGMVSEWYIADGIEVTKGDMLYALETEKVNLDVDAEVTGVVRHQVDVGVMMEPGDVVGYIFEEGEDIPEKLADSPAPAKQAVALSLVEKKQISQARPEVAKTGGRVPSSPAARRLAKESGIDLAQIKGSGPGGRIVESDVVAARDSGSGASSAPAAEVKASPLAKRLAKERGIDLATIKGSGPGGRIVQEDLDGDAATSISPVGPVAGEKVPVKGMRRTIAQRMFSSLQNSAQLTMDMEAVMDDAVKLRTQLIAEWEGEGIRPTYTDLVVKAVARALVKHPRINSIFGESEITLLSDCNVGIAVALPEGLVVPVIRGADKLSLKEIAVESARLASAAREGSLGLDDYAGGTFTVSALGMFGVDSFTPILNDPQAGILGVNRIYDGVAWDGDRPVKTKKMNLSLTWDHRVLDGAPAAEFLSTVQTLLSEPYRLLV